MRRILLLMPLFMAYSLSSQSLDYDAAVAGFQEHYNKADAEAVFSLFSPLMQQSVNLNTTSQIVSSFHMRFGEMKSFEYSSEEGAVKLYNAFFERGKQAMRITLNPEGKFTGLLFKPFEDDAKPKINRNVTALSLPFKGEWFTIWGGDTKPQNYHVVDRAQRHAFDFLIIGKGNKTYERSGTRNEDYFAFGKPVYAVCDAEVALVITGVEDNKPGSMNPAQPLGNSVILKTDKEEYIVYAHFENETVRVKQGERVKKGQLLGNCGNSGNSSEAHLHLHIQDGPDIFSDIGVKCYFNSLMVNGKLETDYSPVRLDRISPTEE